MTCSMSGRVLQRLWPFAGACLLTLVAAAPAHAVATVAADTTRSSSGDPLAAGRATSLVAGGGSQTLLRFRVHGLGGAPARAVLRLHVTDATVESLAVRALPPAFGEDDGTPAQLAPGPTAISSAFGAQSGTWAEFDVTSAVQGDGDVGLQVSGPVLDPASFSSREGPDAPQLVVTPDDDRGVRLAGLLEPKAADVFVGHARDDLGNSLDGLDVAAAVPGQGVPGRYIGVYHVLVAGVFVAKVATSDDLTTWIWRADIDTHASQPVLATLPDGGFVLAFERDTPDPQFVSDSNLVVRHYADWAALAAAAPDRQVDLPRTLAQTAEGTPGLSISSWNGPDASQIAITFHYLKNISVDRQAAGVLTNFAAAGWAPQPDAAVNSLFIGLGTRGNLGDRADLLFEGHPFAVLEAQSVKTDFGTWRWYLYDRERDEARLLALHAPAGSYALGNPTVRALTGPAGQPLLFFSGFAFSEGAGPGEAGQFIALRNAATGTPPAPAPGPIPDPVPAAPPPVPAVSGQPPAAAPRVPAPSVSPPADTTAPTARLSGGRQKLGATVAVGITCLDEGCLATTTATIRVPGVGRAPAKTYRLRAHTTAIAAGGRARVRLAVPSRVRAAIRRLPAGGRKIAVKVRVEVADRAGNVRTLTRQIVLLR
ncbi:MAG: hypothetical protein QOE11_1593 [Solirubrobacteraceae bacterium]|nr:hypothetical protein [Solirubrobacteraceae bacterium]